MHAWESAIKPGMHRSLCRSPCMQLLLWRRYTGICCTLPECIIRLIKLPPLYIFGLLQLKNYYNRKPIKPGLMDFCYDSSFNASPQEPTLITDSQSVPGLDVWSYAGLPPPTQGYQGHRLAGLLGLCMIIDPLPFPVEPDEFHPDSAKTVIKYLCLASTVTPFSQFYDLGSMVGPNQAMHYCGMNAATWMMLSL